MPRRSILSAAERESLLAFPDTEEELIRHYTFSETDLSLIRQRRGDGNRLGIAVQMCLQRFPGQSFADKLLVHERTIYLRGVEERDATIHCSSQHRNHLLFRSGNGTMARAGSHATQPDGGNFKTTSSQFALFHVFLLGAAALATRRNPYRGDAGAISDHRLQMRVGRILFLRDFGRQLSEFNSSLECDHAGRSVSPEPHAK